MNVLIDQLPTSLMVDGMEYPIDSSHRTAIRCLLAFEDNDLTGVEKVAILIENIFDTVPDNIEAAVQAATEFLDGSLRSENPSDDHSPVRVFSLSKDADFIFAAFQQTHGIDLQKADLHWWKFLALFSDLGSDTTFCQLIGLRKRVKTGKASKEERKVAAEMGDMFTLPEIDNRSLADKIAAREFEAKVKAAKEKRGR